MATALRTEGLDLLRESRLDRGLTIRQAAVAIGVSFKTLQRAETGRATPYPGTRRLIAVYYRLKPSDIWPIGASEKAPA
jgi:transcriptional regulator with XRE-family HTH domain